jgi:hypothetical protein
MTSTLHPRNILLKELSIQDGKYTDQSEHVAEWGTILKVFEY